MQIVWYESMKGAHQYFNKISTVAELSLLKHPSLDLKLQEFKEHQEGLWYCVCH